MDFKGRMDRDSSGEVLLVSWNCSQLSSGISLTKKTSKKIIKANVKALLSAVLIQSDWIGAPGAGVCESSLGGPPCSASTEKLW